MTAPVHFEVEVGYGCLYQPACENAAGRDAIADIDRDVEMTTIEAEVTCRRCLKALGYEGGEQLTETHGDPFLDRRAA